MAGEGVSGLAGLSQVGVLGGGGGEGDGLTVCLGRCWSPVPSGCTRGLLSSGSEAVLAAASSEAWLNKITLRSNGRSPADVSRPATTAMMPDL